MVLSDDGRRAFVAHAVGIDVDVVDLELKSDDKVASMGSLDCDPGAMACLPSIPTQAGQGFAITRSVSPPGRVLVPHARIRTTATSPSGYGSGESAPTEMFSVAVLDEDTGTPIKASIDSEAGLACLLPRAAAVTDDGQLLVACLGTNEIVSMDEAAANPHQAVAQRFRVPAGPVGIAVDDTRPRALVWSAFDRALTWILLRGQDGFVLAWEKLPARHPLPEAVEHGRRLFNATDARMSVDGRACASCHPDGRDDCNVWSTPDGPRNPPMLAGRLADTEPYGWLGAAPDLMSHLKQTLSRLGGKKLPNDDQKALATYVAWMKPPTVAKTQTISALVIDGKRIFESSEAACGTCHGHEGQVPDGQRHNVLSWAEGDRTGVLDTPSLRFIGGTAPYFHDGRYISLRALLTHTRGAMGQDKKLSEHELDALEAYLRTL